MGGEDLRDEVGGLQRGLELWPVKAEDELAVDVGDRDAAKLAAAFFEQFFFCTRVFLDVLGDVGKGWSSGYL